MTDPRRQALDQSSSAAERAAKLRRAYREGTFRRYLADEAKSAREAVEEFEKNEPRSDGGTVGTDPPRT